MNLLRELSKNHSYPEISARIEAVTGRKYTTGHLGNVARGNKPLNSVLRLHLKEAFPEKFLSTDSTAIDLVSTSVKEQTQ